MYQRSQTQQWGRVINGLEITDVRVALAENNRPGTKLRAFAVVELNGAILIRNLKVIETHRLFVSMPSRKTQAACLACRHLCHLGATYCERCGDLFRYDPAVIPPSQREEVEGQNWPSFLDILHPVTMDCRRWLENAVLAEYQTELGRRGSPVDGKAL